MRRAVALIALSLSCSSKATPPRAPAEEPIRVPDISPAEKTSQKTEVRGRLLGVRLEIWVAGPDGAIPLEVTPRAYNDPLVVIRATEPFDDDTLIALPEQDFVRSATIVDGGLQLELHSSVGTDVMHDAERPEAITVLPRHCAGCEIDGSRCIEWVTMDCGLERTCAGEFDCEAGCCG